MSKQIEIDNAGGGVHYYGEAPLGTATTAVGWTLKRMTIASNDLVVEYPIGSTGSPTDEGEFKWADRATLNYSLIPDVTVPTLSTVTIASDNDTTTLAKVGDVVTITIVASEFIQAPTVTMCGRAATVTEGVDDLHFTAAITMASGDPTGVVPFTIDFEDVGGNAGTQVTEVTGGASVTFDKTSPTATLLYSINGGSDYFASLTVKNADTLRIKATFSEALLDSPVVKLAIDNAVLAATNMTKTSTTVYYYDLNVPAGDIAIATCSLSVGTDAAGNIVTAAPTANATFAIDNTVPTMSSAARDTNTQITITMSEAMAAASVTNANDGGFVVTRTGEVDTYAVSAVAAGESANLVVLTVADMDTAEAEGVTVTYATGGNATATDVAGNALATDATGEVIATWAV